MRLDDQFAEAAARLSRADWAELTSAHVLLTGGTGFVGKWLVGTLLATDRAHGLGLRICIPSRDPAAFVRHHPDLATNSAVDLVAGDICDAASLLSGRRFTHIIHAATDASAKLNREDPLRMIDTVVGGTREILRLAEAAPPRRLLFISSGAVYGPQPADLAGLPETWTGGPDPLSAGAAYHEAKRLAEQMCAAAARTRGLPHVGIARLFAFVGPFLPLDTHFAIGNFIRDALAGKTIVLSGDGTTTRSYQYAGDMTAWLLAVLLRGAPMRAYNVGSSRAVRMGELAQLIAGGRPIEVRGRPDPARPIDRYVPDVGRIIGELAVQEWTGLEEAIHRTIGFHRRLKN